MQQIVDAILDYVKKENTDYAVMVDGSWGSGKTYFWENTLRPEIENQDVGGKKIKTIYISLYGIENLNDISKSIFYEVYSPTNDKLKKVTQSKVGNVISEMGKMLINTGSGLLNLNLPNSADINYDKLFDLENKVLCFDDLERANLDISQMLGYINNFVEHDHTKVIILCNEKEISNNLISNNLELKSLVSAYVLDKGGKLNSKELLQGSKAQNDLINQGIIDLFDRSNNYKRIKEKLIGKSLRYTAEYKSIIENIVKSLSNNDEYNNFLKDNLEIVYETFILSDTYNIRSLKQSLWDFETIYIPSKVFYPNIDVEILKRMLIFNIAISLEIKSGKSVNLFEDINSNEELQSKLIMYKMSEENKNKTSIEEEFINKYFPKSLYNVKIFFNSINKLVREGMLNKVTLKDELDSLMQDDKTPPHYKLMKSFWELSDEEFNAALEITYNNVLSGDIAFPYYLRVFILFNHLRKMGLLKKSKENITKDIFRGLSKAGEKGTFFEDLNITFFNLGDIEEDEHIRLLKQEIVKINQNLLKRSEQEAVLQLVEEIKQKPSKVFKKLREEYMYSPFFYYCEIEELFVVVKQLSNSNLAYLRNFILNRHKNNYEKLDIDFPNLVRLKKYIDDYILNKNITLSISLLNELSSTIEDVTDDKDIESGKTKKRVKVKKIRTGRKINRNNKKFRTGKRKVRKSRT